MVRSLMILCLWLALWACKGHGQDRDMGTCETNDDVGLLQLDAANKSVLQYVSVQILDTDDNPKRNFDGSCIDQQDFSLCFQSDGNLVIRSRPSKSRSDSVCWATGTWGHPDGATLEIQTDGNMVVYSPGHEPQWTTGSTGLGGGQYEVYWQTDGNLVVYRTWSGVMRQVVAETGVHDCGDYPKHGRFPQKQI